MVLICSFEVYFKWSAISGVRNIGLFDLWRFKKIMFLILKNFGKKKSFEIFIETPRGFMKMTALAIRTYQG